MKLFISLIFLNAVGAIANSGWTVFTPSDPQTNNLVLNSSMNEIGSTTPLRYWNHFGEGYTSDFTVGHGDSSSLCINATSSGIQYGGYQSIVLNQTKAVPLYFSGWSRAENVSGSSDIDYSLYIDILYTNGQHLWGQTINFSTGTHDWEFKERIIIPEHPIKSLNCFALLRNNHTGTAWFDNINVLQWNEDSTIFDYISGEISTPTNSLFDFAENTSLETSDGLRLELSKLGGAVVGLQLGAEPIADTNVSFASGFFIRDISRDSALTHVGGVTTQADESTILQYGTFETLDIALTATYSVSAIEPVSTNFGSINIHADITDISSSNERFLTVYFALPVTITNGLWWDDARTSRQINSDKEFSSHWLSGWGANGYISRYPFGVLSWEEGLAMAIPLDTYRLCRFSYNKRTSQLFAAFDIGISSTPERFNKHADLELTIFKFDPEWGMRSALEKYYQLFPDLFGKRFTNEGVWVAFSNLSPITNISDYNIAYHETSNKSYWKYDDTIGVSSYRYVSEPWSIWLGMPSALSNNNYETVIAYVTDIKTNGTVDERTRSEVILSSGIHDQNGRFVFTLSTAPWLPGNYGVVFIVNPNPNLNLDGYTTNKALMDWNDDVRDVYNQPANGILDGEYIDSFEAYGATPSYRTNHFSSSDFPLCFRAGENQLALPEIYSTYSLSRDISDYVHSINKPIIANSILLNWAFPAHLFDMMGTEVNWFNSEGELNFPDHSSYLFKRSMCAKKPYCLLMNTNFDNMGTNEVEKYFRYCLFYGIYPSMFSHNAAENAYWDTPSLYNRDRYLFKKYIPVILAMNRGGWEPVTYARSSAPEIYIERFGSSNQTYIATRNTVTNELISVITIELEQLGFASNNEIVVNHFPGGDFYTTDYGNGMLTITQTLSGLDTEVIHISNIPESSLLFIVNLFLLVVRNKCDKSNIKTFAKPFGVH